MSLLITIKNLSESFSKTIMKCSALLKSVFSTNSYHKKVLRHDKSMQNISNLYNKIKYVRFSVRKAQNKISLVLSQWIPDGCGKTKGNVLKNEPNTIKTCRMYLFFWVFLTSYEWWMNEYECSWNATFSKETVWSSRTGLVNRVFSIRSTATVL